VSCNVSSTGCRGERSQQEQALEEASARHKLSVAALQHEQERRLRDEDFNATLANERTRHEEEMRRERKAVELQSTLADATRAAELQKYETLKGLGVDLTQYLVALATARPDSHLKIDSNTAPSVHLELPPTMRRAK